jgi:predicted regulator of Ras-like GTPase activity (Roadblock/LC7/MglB family)
MSEDLRALLMDVRSDFGEDFVAADIVGPDGMSIAGVNTDAEYGAELVAASTAMIMKTATKVSSQLNLGKVTENLLTTNGLIAASRTLGDGSFYWLVVARSEATLGMLRAVMDQYEMRIWAAIPT